MRHPVYRHYIDVRVHKTDENICLSCNENELQSCRYKHFNRHDK